MFGFNLNCCTSKDQMPLTTTITATTIEEGGTTLLIIDPQNDFHPGDGNSLSVPNADKDTERITALIRRSIAKGSKFKINRIVVTLDSHHKLHIAHPTFWVDKNGKHPSPFTVIPSSDIENGKWKPRGDLKLPIGERLLDLNIMGKGSLKDKITYTKDGTLDLLAYCIEYAKALEKSGKFVLVIWPEHCLIGSRGHNVDECLNEALFEWNAATGRSVEYVSKGQNLLTEMYSALSAEVPISSGTEFNQELFDSLNKSNRILVTGQALSHCVNNTTRDLMDHMKAEEKKKVFMLEDCSSSVPTFEASSEEFLKYVKDQGGTVCKADQIV